MPKIIEIVNVRLPDKLILELDALVERRIFKSRSEAIREFARIYVHEQKNIQKNAKMNEGGGRW